jgi:hypothetical protein
MLRAERMMPKMPSEKFCLWLMVGGAMIFLIATLAPFFIPGFERNVDLIASGFVTLCVATFLYFRSKAARTTFK